MGVVFVVEAVLMCQAEQIVDTSDIDGHHGPDAGEARRTHVREALDQPAATRRDLVATGRRGATAVGRGCPRA